MNTERTMTSFGGKPGRDQAGGVAAAPAWPAGFEAIWAVITAIPAGRTCSYGEVARRAGLPRRARLVARALREAPKELALPWHRVLRADGRIAFAPDTPGFRRQRQALQAEGVEVDAGGRVRSQPAAYEDDLDAALWRL